MIITFFEFGGNILNKHKGKLPDSSLYPETNTETSISAHQGQYFKIRIKGQLSHLWADWFEGLTIKHLNNGEMLLSGYIADQSALMGMLNKLVRLNLTLISLSEIKKHKEKK
jgi:hypothetical protein